MLLAQTEAYIVYRRLDFLLGYFLLSFLVYFHLFLWRHCFVRKHGSDFRVFLKEGVKGR
jgi:hypothetical protein